MRGPRRSRMGSGKSGAVRGRMKGVQFLVDEPGKKTAVLIDLRKHEELWEDLFDSVLAAERRAEPRETLESVKERLRHRGKRRARA